MGHHPPQRGAGVLGPAALLLLLPLATYWSSIFHDYGLRDDYSILREAVEEPGKVLRVCASQGRPLYGWILELSARSAAYIHHLCWMRLGGAMLLGLLGSTVFLLLVQVGWQSVPAALLAAFVPMTLPAQVLVSWGICWPHVLALLLGAAAFTLADRGPRWGWGVLAALVMATAALLYQSNSLFYVVPVAASLAVSRRGSLKADLRWLTWHLGVMGVGLGLAFAVMKLTFVTGLFTPSPRIAFETHWPSKAGWVVSHVLPHALALLVLDDVQGAGAGVYWGMVIVTLAVVSVGTVLEGRRFGAAGSGRWLVGLAVLSAAAYCVSFLASERWLTYRTLFALTGVWSVFFAASLVNLGSCWPSGGRVATGLLAVFVAVGVFLAHRQSLELFALPQGRELALMREGADQAERLDHPRVFVITARQDDSSAPRRYRDEFGSVSIDAEWVAKEVFKALMRERHPELRDVSGLYRFAAGPKEPEPRTQDVVIDMRRIRPLRAM